MFGTGTALWLRIGVAASTVAGVSHHTTGLVGVSLAEGGHHEELRLQS